MLRTSMGSEPGLHINTEKHQRPHSEAHKSGQIRLPFMKRYSSGYSWVQLSARWVKEVNNLMNSRVVWAGWCDWSWHSGEQPAYPPAFAGLKWRPAGWTGPGQRGSLNPSRPPLSLTWACWSCCSCWLKGTIRRQMWEHIRPSSDLVFPRSSVSALRSSVHTCITMSPVTTGISLPNSICIYTCSSFWFVKTK